MRQVVVPRVGTLSLVRFPGRQGVNACLFDEEGRFRWGGRGRWPKYEKLLAASTTSWLDARIVRTTDLATDPVPDVCLAATHGQQTAVMLLDPGSGSVRWCTVLDGFVDPATDWLQTLPAPPGARRAVVIAYTHRAGLQRDARVRIVGGEAAPAQEFTLPELRPEIDSEHGASHVHVDWRADPPLLTVGTREGVIVELPVASGTARTTDLRVRLADRLLARMAEELPKDQWERLARRIGLRNGVASGTWAEVGHRTLEPAEWRR